MTHADNQEYQRESFYTQQTQQEVFEAGVAETGEATNVNFDKARGQSVALDAAKHFEFSEAKKK